MHPSNAQQNAEHYRLHDDTAGAYRAELCEAMEDCTGARSTRSPCDFSPGFVRALFANFGNRMKAIHQTLSARYSVIVFRVTETTNTIAISTIAITAPISKNK